MQIDSLEVKDIILLHYSFQASEIRSRSASLCAELGPQSLAVADAFAATPEMLSAPIARDWVSYNEYDNVGELKQNF
jgi:hypothetical protein